MSEKRFENKKIKIFFAGIFKFENHKKFKLKTKLSIWEMLLDKLL
ncbi:hypothetical protein SN10121_00720 [Ligilactobacillus agilis]|nr:hypothetical protein SN10121_00720 [Ligilactobacillus agilis]